MMSDWKQKLPLQLTLSRVYILPLIILCLWSKGFSASLLAAGLFVVASITDYYDGYFARKFNAVSNMGKFMDPVADKILVTGVLTYLLYLDAVDPFMVIILMIRDTFIGGLRAVAAADNVIIAAKAGGKWKTGLQMVAIPALMINTWPDSLEFIVKTAHGALWLSVLLSITSGIEYYRGYKDSRRAAG